MTKDITIKKCEPDNPQHLEAIAALWTVACGPALAISPRFVSYNLQPAEGVQQVGLFAWQGDEPIGFVLASALHNEPTVTSAQQGWIDAVAVLPVEQHRGIGKMLLTWAEDWLASGGCETISLGGSLRPFTPGLPVELEQRARFEQLGYTSHGNVWDVAANLALYERSHSVREVNAAVRPAQPGQEQALRDFLQREFPGRWHDEFARFLQNKERLSDFMLLWTERGVDGFCRLTFEDSARPIERFYPYALPRPWGQLGPIGVSSTRRGMGYGAGLLDAGLRRMHNNGINGCIVDWTNAVDFYAKFGFEPHREYLLMKKQSR